MKRGKGIRSEGIKEERREMDKVLKDKRMKRGRGIRSGGIRG